MKKLAIALLLAGCGGLAMITPEVQREVIQQLPQMSPMGGQLCVCRTSYFIGMAAVFDFYANGEYIGRLPNSSHFCVNLTPGEYNISTKYMLVRTSEEIIIRQGQRKFMELQLYASGSMSLDTTDPETGLSCIYSTM